MSASQLFDWPTARKALHAGWRVRRSGWTDRWLERWTGGLIWLILNDGTTRVVRNTDFGADEFLALDWTNLPATCVTDGTTPGTGTNGCPLPYNSTTSNSGTTSNSSVGGSTYGGSTTGGSTTGGSSALISPDQPPSGSTGGGQTGSGSGGGGGSGTGGGNRTRRDNSNTEWPSITLDANDSQINCYAPSTANNGFIKPILTGTVGLTAVSNSYTGPSMYLVTVKNASSVVWSGWLSPGNSSGFLWHDPNNAVPGSTLTLTARAWATGAPDIQGSKAVELLPWCQYALAFDCAADGGYCHTGVGWVTVRDATATLIYDGCPDQGSLGLGAGVVITAGCTVTVRYSNSDGPCPGGHCCNSAIFNITLWHSGHSVAVGTANLNNGSDCGGRGPFTFPITQAMMDALETP